MANDADVWPRTSPFLHICVSLLKMAPLVPGLQLGEQTAHSIHAKKDEKKEKVAGKCLSTARRPPGVAAESANISRLSGVKADESHLA